MSFSIKTSFNWNAPPKFLQRTEPILHQWADLRVNTGNFMLPRNFLIHRYAKFAFNTKHHSSITYGVNLFIRRGIQKIAYYIIKSQEEPFIRKSSQPRTDRLNYTRNSVIIIFTVQDKFNFPTAVATGARDFIWRKLRSQLSTVSADSWHKLVQPTLNYDPWGEGWGAGIIFLSSINRFICVMEMQDVCCKAGT
jgi:hypothetical protein